jgi:K+-sensing histidine kinase KdpD
LDCSEDVSLSQLSDVLATTPPPLPRKLNRTIQDVTSDARMQAVRFGLVVATAGVITAIDFRLHVNPTTVALTFLVTVLLVSAYWGLRYALVLAVAATGAFNFYFLPPIGTFRIADPQNWVALVAFLITAKWNCFMNSVSSFWLRRMSSDS